MELIFLGGIIMKKGFVIATVAMSLGIIAPLSQVVTSTPVSAKTTSHSYVTTTSNSISVTNIRKGSTVVLKIIWDKLLQLKQLLMLGQSHLI